jgi:hypothetical protein
MPVLTPEQYSIDDDYSAADDVLGVVWITTTFVFGSVLCR